MAQETILELPDGKSIVVEHEGELTDEAVRNIMSQLGYEQKKEGLGMELLGEGTRIAGALTGAIKGSRRGLPGAIIGGLIGGALAEPVASEITPHEETKGENLANIALAGVQPAAKPASLAVRLARGAVTGAGLGSLHKAAQVGIDEGRLPTPEELAPVAGIGAVIGAPLEGILGPRARQLAQNLTPQTKELPITAALDKPKPKSLEQANAEANQIATSGSATAKQSAQATPTPVAQEKPIVVSADDDDALEAAAEAQAASRRVSVDDEDAIEAAAAAQADSKPKKKKSVKNSRSSGAPIPPAWASSTSDIDLAGKGVADGVKVIPTGQEWGPGKAVIVASYDKDGVPNGILKIAVDSSGLPVGQHVVVRPDSLRSGVATKLYNTAIDQGIDVTKSIGSGGGLTKEGKAFTDSFIKGRTAAKPSLKSDRAEYDKLQAKMAELNKAGKAGTKEFNEVWEASEAIKNRHKGMPPGEVAGGDLPDDLNVLKAPEATETPKAVESAPIAPETPVAPPPEAPIPVRPFGEEPEFKVRGHAKRAIESEFIPPAVRQAIKEDPKILYERHKQGDWVNRAEAATDTELLQMIDEAASLDESIIYKREHINRLIASGNREEAARIWVGQAESMTPAAQTLSAARLIRTAFGDLVEAEDVAAKAGRVLSEEQKEKVLKLASKEIEAQKALNQATKRAKEFYSEETYKEFLKAQEDFGKASKEFAEYTQAIAPRDFADMAVKMIQGNLLTPLSITSNVAGNLIFGPLSRVSMSVASMIDLLATSGVKAVARATGKDPSKVKRAIDATNPLPSTEELKAMAQALRTASREIVEGPSAESYGKLEVQSGFRPWRSMMDFIHGTNLPLDEKGNVARWDRTKAFIEGTLGIPPEVMFRMLAIGDKPFRRAAEVRAILEQARIKGIKDKDLEKFLRLPDERTAALAQQAGRRAVFAEENTGITTLNRFLDSDMAKLLRVDKIPILAGAMKVFGRLVVPFRQFPVNYALTAMNFAAPPLALSKSAFYTYKAMEVLSDKGMSHAAKAAASLDYRRKAFINLGEAALGGMMYTAAGILWKNGLISESSADTAAKRSDQSEKMGAAKLNVDGLDRYMNGGDPSYQKGDKLIEWTRLGIPAVIFHIYTDQASREQEKAAKLGEETPDFSALNAKNLIGAAPGLGSFVFDQSFLAGTSSLLEAIKDPDPDSPKFKNWLQNMFRAVTAMAIPNSVEAVARTRMDYIPDLRGETIPETMKNIWDFKTMKMGNGEVDTVYKRDTWGRKIKRTPEGANPYVYNMIDVTKSGAQKADPYDQALYDLFVETKRDGVYPDPVGRTFTMPNGSTVELAPDYYEKLQEMVGTMRREAMESFVGSPVFSRLDPNERVLALEKIYENANTRGRQRFLAESALLLDQESDVPRNKTVSRSTKGVLIRDYNED